MMILREVRMSCTNGHSDKQYDLSIQYDNITYHVMAHYGRRGTSLIPTRKGDYADPDSALQCFNKLMREKTRKGYIVESDTGEVQIPLVPPTEPTGTNTSTGHNEVWDALMLGCLG